MHLPNLWLQHLELRTETTDEPCRSPVRGLCKAMIKPASNSNEKIIFKSRTFYVFQACFFSFSSLICLPFCAHFCRTWAYCLKEGVLFLNRLCLLHFLYNLLLISAHDIPFKETLQCNSLSLKKLCVTHVCFDFHILF